MAEHEHETPKPKVKVYVNGRECDDTPKLTADEWAYIQIVINKSGDA